MLVVDASVIVALLVDGGALGEWAADTISGQRLAAPHHMPAEVASVLRRTSATGLIGAETASLALADLGKLAARYVAFEPFADRVWELRDAVTVYDAWYVALAEALNAPLVTFDGRLAAAPGPRCSFLSP